MVVFGSYHAVVRYRVRGQKWEVVLLGCTCILDYDIVHIGRGRPWGARAASELLDGRGGSKLTRTRRRR